MSSLAQVTHPPSLTLPLKQNYHLPRAPGQHGLVLQDLRKYADDMPVDQDIPIFVGIERNNWNLVGTYNTQRWCEVEPGHIARLPPQMLDKWARAYVHTEAGREWIKSANEELTTQAAHIGDKPELVEQTLDSIREALRDGRMSFTFTLLECVGYPYAWFDRLEEEMELKKEMEMESVEWLDM